MLFASQLYALRLLFVVFRVVCVSSVCSLLAVRCCSCCVFQMYAVCVLCGVVRFVFLQCYVLCLCVADLGVVFQLFNLWLMFAVFRFVCFF